MKDISEIRACRVRDPLPVRLGRLAADLARIAWFSRNPANLEPVPDLMREPAHFAEWCAPEADLQSQVTLLELQHRPTCWRDQLPQRFPDSAWRDQMITEAQQ